MLTALPVSAWQRPSKDMNRIAREHLLSRAHAAATPASVKLVLERDMLNVYAAEGAGYVIVSRSTDTAPVLGYSDGRFDPDNMPDGLRWWIEQTDRCLAAAESDLTRATGEVVEPLVKTYWAQDRPYNDLCPTTGGFWGSAPQTGCVATAMAQVLKYFNYPASSTGTGEYSLDGGQSFKTVTMDTKYSWDDMLNRYNAGYNDKQAKAVAELMRDCGYVSRMIYTDQGSGANLYDAAYGLSHMMRYDSLSMRVRTRAYYHDDEWMDMIRKELRSSRPIQYAATDPNMMAHSFVFDGMDANGLVHVNWGWAGDANGYFDVSNLHGLKPSYPNPYTGGMVSYDFSDEQIMITGFNPSETPAEGARYESFFASYTCPEVSFDNDELQIETIPVFNLSHLDFQGLLGLVIEGEDGHAVVQPFFYSAFENNIAIPVIGGVYYPEAYYAHGTLNDSNGTTPRPDGKYLLYFVSWSVQEMDAGYDPQMIHIPVEGSKPNYAVWEANIVNGHWDAASLKRHDTSGGVEEVRADVMDNNATPVAYSLDGRCLGNPESVAKGTPIIIRQGNTATKVIR